MTTYQIYSKAANECLEFDPTAEEYRPWITQPCTSTSKQVLDFQEQKDGNYKIKAPDTDKFLTVTYKNDWDAFGAHGNDDVRARSQEIEKRSQVEIIGTNSNTGNYGKKAIENGPFKIKGLWQLPGDFSNRVLTVSDTKDYQNEILQNWKDTESDKQVFINNQLKTKCESKGVSFNDCNLTSIRSCNLLANQNAQDCPDTFCRTQRGIKTGECQEYARNNPNFDETVGKYCADNPDDPFCSCYGKMDTEVAQALAKNGIILKKVCNEPKCVDSNTAYRTTVMKSQMCSPIQACIQGIETTANSASISNVQFSCQQTSTPVDNTETKPTTSPTEPPTETKPTAVTSQGAPIMIRNIVLSAIAIVILLFILILI
jgi:hypothetical protein